jgi:choline monooxygenase
MSDSLDRIVASYDPSAPLEEAATIPASWYIDTRVADLERRTTFSRAWLAVGRADEVRAPGQFVCAELPSGDPVVVVRGRDGVLRGFFNVCRHHAAAVATEPAGTAEQFRCPYHGWTYGLDGALKGTPDFIGVRNFDRAANGLVPVRTDVWAAWVFVTLDRAAPPLAEFLGAELIDGVRSAGVERYHWVERRRYRLDCNWKVFVDNYLDGGYHVPYLHKGLDSVLSYRDYTIACGDRFCLQSSPLVTDGADPATADVRQGDLARYYWIYPNFMVNCYGGAMDTNLVLPAGVDRTEVIFDFFFADVSEGVRERNRASIDVSHTIQDEDEAICRSVQKGLGSRAYVRGRLSVRREAGEHLFHRLLHADFVRGTEPFSVEKGSVP